MVILNSKLRSFFIGSLVVIGGGCGSVELNGQQRPGLGQNASIYDAEIMPRSMPSGQLEPGLWLTIRNDLPVIRQDGQIISQAFLEVEAVAFDQDERRTAASSDATSSGRRAATDDGQNLDQVATSLRYVMRGRVLSESELSFWISPQQLDALVKKSGGQLSFSVKDSVQYSSFPFPCWVGGSRAFHQVRPSTQVSVQHLNLTVEGRYRMSYKCTIN